MKPAQSFSVLYTKPFGWGFSGSKGITQCTEVVKARDAEHAGEKFLLANKGKRYTVKAIDPIK